MNGPMIGSKAFSEFLNFKSAESSADIPVGTPIAFNINATEDGFNAVLPSTATAAKMLPFFAGVNVSPLAVSPNRYGSAQVWGVCNYALVVQQSRAASTNSYATAAALSTGQFLSVDTVNNAFATVGAQTVVTAATSGTAASDIQFGTATLQPLGGIMAVLAQSLASAASSASTSSDSSVKKTYGLKVWLRAL